jgi:small subunit ribosomal protein S1
VSNGYFKERQKMTEKNPPTEENVEQIAVVEAPTESAAEPEAVAAPEVVAAPEAVAEPEAVAAPEVAAEPEVVAAPEAAKAASEEFGRLLEVTGTLPKRPPQPGEKIKCLVVSVSEDGVFVSFGGKSEATIKRSEFAIEGDDVKEGSGAKRPVLPAEGDELEAYVLSVRDGEVTFTTNLTQRDQSRGAIEDAFQAGFPVEGRVAKSIKGGFEVRVSGLRAFCPLSQIDIRWPKDVEVHVGKIYAFKVSEYKERGRNIVVSRRALLEEERVTKREELKKKIKVGENVTGVVRNIQNFGVFVDLGGVDGLIPASELSWSRVNPSEVVEDGQEVTAKVIGADWDKERISLSLKALASDPWVQSAEKYSKGQRITGKVARLTDFGAFVEIEPGLDGMIHVSAMGTTERIKHPKEVLEVGQEVEAEIDSLDMQKRRVSLSLDYKLFEGLGDLPRVHSKLDCAVEKVADFGVFVKLPTGHVGVIANSEMNTRRGAEHKGMFKPGDPIEAQVIEVSQQGKRIRLSIKALVRQQERDDRKEFEAFKGDEKASMGTFADLLKAKLGK